MNEQPKLQDTKWPKKRMEMEMEDMAKKMQKELGIRSTEFKIG